MKPEFIAGDFGAESGRVIVGRLTGRKLTLEEVHRFPNPQVRILGHFYWDVLHLFRELKRGLILAAQSGCREPAGIGLDTWGVDFGLVNEDGTLSGFPVAYRDSRTDGMMEAAFERVPRDELYQLTGIQLMQINTVFQLLSLARREASALQSARRLLFMPDLFNYLLTGVSSSEETIASTSQLLDARTRTWSDGLFERLGLPIEIMPEIRPSGSILGSLLPEVQEETGVTASVIAPAGHDTACAVAAVPAAGDDWAFLSSGTWSLLGAELKAPIINQASLKANFTNEGGFAGRIRFLRNNMGMWLLERCRAKWRDRGEDVDYGQLVELAEAAAKARSLFDPDHPSLLNPPDMPRAIAECCRTAGQPVPEDKGQFVRAIFESLALKYRLLLEHLERLRGRPITRLHVVGGGSRNRLLNQLTADATGIEVIAGPAEATATGNILIQAVAAGFLSGLDEVREVVRNTVVPGHYQPRNREAWDARYEDARKLFR